MQTIQGEAVLSLSKGHRRDPNRRISAARSGMISPGRAKSRSSNTISHCFQSSCNRPPPPRHPYYQRVGRRVPSHHHSPKAYHSRLAFFLAVYWG
jgi:hypothetical protein